MLNNKLQRYQILKKGEDFYGIIDSCSQYKALTFIKLKRGISRSVSAIILPYDHMALTAEKGDLYFMM